MSPVISVIIPTAGRTESLGKAIKSSLDIVDDCEVLVVPNGPSSAWRALIESFSHDRRVKWLPLDYANVSEARNQGLLAARGKYVRFLDDDDYFYAEACRRQLDAALAEGADICSGAIAVVNDDGRYLKTRSQPETHDLCIAACGPSRLVQVGAHMYKLEAAQQVLWNTARSLAEDVQWFLEFATIKERKWLRTAEPVAAWVQHRGVRLSTGHDPGRDSLEYLANTIMQSAERLSLDERLTYNRRVAVADGLWSLLQKGLRYDYAYWCQVAAIANEYAGGRTPPSRIYRHDVIRRIDPLLIESALIPIRWAYHPVRKILDYLYINRI